VLYVKKTPYLSDISVWSLRLLSTGVALGLCHPSPTPSAPPHPPTSLVYSFSNFIILFIRPRIANYSRYGEKIKIIPSKPLFSLFSIHGYLFVVVLHRTVNVQLYSNCKACNKCVRLCGPQVSQVSSANRKSANFHNFLQLRTFRKCETLRICDFRT
jgi:hypothetical protein